MPKVRKMTLDVDFSKKYWVNQQVLGKRSDGLSMCFLFKDNFKT
jgi:hypothetical protein